LPQPHPPKTAVICIDSQFHPFAISASHMTATDGA
jgi:hypothetical protein